MRPLSTCLPLLHIPEFLQSTIYFSLLEEDIHLKIWNKKIQHSKELYEAIFLYMILHLKEEWKYLKNSSWRREDTNALFYKFSSSTRWYFHYIILSQVNICIKWIVTESYCLPEVTPLQSREQSSAPNEGRTTSDHGLVFISDCHLLHLFCQQTTPFIIYFSCIFSSRCFCAVWGLWKDFQWTKKAVSFRTPFKDPYRRETIPMSILSSQFQPKWKFSSSHASCAPTSIVVSSCSLIARLTIWFYIQ